MTGKEALLAHLGGGLTTVARCWAVHRKDGKSFGFTDHDCELTFEGITFAADSGLTAAALQQSTGLSVDNTEALGALSSVAVSDADIDAGRFDGAEVRAWLVNWRNPEERWLQFRGTFGDLKRAGGGFRAELRGLTDDLNQPQGWVYQADCSAVLGDVRCKFDLSKPGYGHEGAASDIVDGRVFSFAALPGFDQRWFERGRLEVLDGDAAGLGGIIKNDRVEGETRIIELWEALRANARPGDTVRITAGCDRRPETCRLKFNNFLNFRGFPDIPGEDWLMSYPSSGGANNGGSLKR